MTEHVIHPHTHPLRRGPVSVTEHVIHPAHYNSHPSGVEVIDLIRELPYGPSSAIRYVLRRDLKGNPLQDLKKADFCLQDAEENGVMWDPSERTSDLGLQVSRAALDSDEALVVYTLCFRLPSATPADRLTAARRALARLIGKYEPVGADFDKPAP